VKFLVTTFIFSIIVFIGLLVIAMTSDSWYWKAMTVSAGLAILCVVGMVREILHRKADEDDGA